MPFEHCRTAGCARTTVLDHGYCYECWHDEMEKAKRADVEPEVELIGRYRDSFVYCDADFEEWA